MSWWNISNERERYAAYLCSREWSVKKRAIHERAGGVCERCKRNPIDAVHHKTYARKYDERLEDLEANCNGCHEFTHGKSDIDPMVAEVPLPPIMINGKEIKTIYFASDWSHGLIAALTDWWLKPPDKNLEEIFKWRSQKKNATDDWFRVDGGVRVPGYRPLSYCGPFSMAVSKTLHEAEYFSIFQKRIEPVHDWDSTKAYADARLRLTAIDQADIVIATLASDMSITSVAELCYAFGKGKPVFGLLRQQEPAEQFALVFQCCYPISPAETFQDAWDVFWAEPRYLEI